MVREPDEHKYSTFEVDGRLQYICLMARHVVSRRLPSRTAYSTMPQLVFRVPLLN